LLAILGNQTDTGFDGIFRRARTDCIAVDKDLTGVKPIRAENRPRDLGSAGPDKTCQTNNLTLANCKVDVIQLGCVQIHRVAAAVQAFDLEYGAAERGAVTVGEQPVHFATDHHVDDFFDTEVANFTLADILTIPQNDG